jgi:hypothetical protein
MILADNLDQDMLNGTIKIFEELNWEMFEKEWIWRERKRVKDERMIIIDNKIEILKERDQKG